MTKLIRLEVQREGVWLNYSKWWDYHINNEQLFNTVLKLLNAPQFTLRLRISSTDEKGNKVIEEIGYFEPNDDIQEKVNQVLPPDQAGNWVDHVLFSMLMMVAVFIILKVAS